MPALVTDKGRHAVIQGIRGCGRDGAPRHRRGKPIGRLIEAQPLIKGRGPAWALAGGNLIAGNGETPTLLEPSEGPGG